VRASEGRCVVGGAAPTPYAMRYPGPGRCTIREEVDGRFRVKWTTRLKRISTADFLITRKGSLLDSRALEVNKL
jgi:hypothetical protein